MTAASCTDGYVKYPFPAGINMIFSSIDIAEDDMLDEPVATPMLDHKGIDLRDERSEVRSVFDAVADRAGEVGWRHVPQGRDGQPVYCCHTEVSGKHWVYPVSGEAGKTRPIEFAFGALEIHDSRWAATSARSTRLTPGRRRRRQRWRRAPHRTDRQRGTA